MSGCASHLFPPPGRSGDLSLVAGEANLLFGEFSSPEDLAGQNSSAGLVWQLFHVEEAQIAENKPSSRYVLHFGVPQNQREQNSEVASVIFHLLPVAQF